MELWLRFVCGIARPKSHEGLKLFLCVPQLQLLLYRLLDKLRLIHTFEVIICLALLHFFLITLVIYARLCHQCFSYVFAKRNRRSNGFAVPILEIRLWHEC
jgi:hypothetical protein